jgi:hypothetical protein
MKSKSPFELILFFHNGFAPQEIMKKGYAEGTVYKYSKYYKIALEKFKEKTQ